MNVLCTFPGKYGDILWALSAIRALSVRIGQPVDLVVAAPFASICPLIATQPYIRYCGAVPTWQTENTAPITPRIPYALQSRDPQYDAIFHLGYRDWPRRPLPYETLDCLNAQTPGVPGFRGRQIGDVELALTEPWIQVKRSWELAEVHKCDLAIAFTDEHFELKFGLTLLVLEQFARSAPDMTYAVLCPPGSRWATETWKPTWRALKEVDWQGYANIVADSQLVLADCSAAHVLAVAMGKPVVLMEPNTMRHNSIFYPLGTDGHVLLVKGMDGQPTFHAPHVTDVLKAFYESAKAVRQ